MRALTAATLVAILLAGCTSGRLTGAVGGFGTATSAAVEAQQDQLAAFSTQDASRIKQELADARVALNFSEGCVQLADPRAPMDQCYLVDASGNAVETPFYAANVVALGDALVGYSAALGQLAADSRKDADAFGKSLTDLANSVGALSGAVSKVTSLSKVSPAQLGAVASIVGTVGNLYFEHARATALRKIIVASDPFVQEATAVLAAADEALRRNSTAQALLRLEATSEALEQAIAAGQGAQAIRAKQDAVFVEFDALRQRSALRSGFVLLGDAHRELAAAARAGASFKEMVAYATRLAEAARAIAQAAATLKS